MTMDTKALQEHIVLHGLWLAGTGGARADLRGANLRRATLSRANLRGADLRRANLNEPNLGVYVIVQTGPIGSRRDQLVSMWHPDWPQEEVRTGCFTGTLATLAAQVTSTYPPAASGAEPKSGSEYAAAISYHRAILGLHGWRGA